MKRVLLSLFSLLALGWASNAQAQCSGTFGPDQYCGTGSAGGFPGPKDTSTIVPGNARSQYLSGPIIYVNGTGAPATCSYDSSIGGNTFTCGTGNDSTGDGTTGTPYQTLTKALSVVNSMDIAAFHPLIVLAYGSSVNYGGVTCANMQVGGPASSVNFITGDANSPGSVHLVAPNSGEGIYASDGCLLKLEFLVIDNEGTAADGIRIGQGAIMDIQTVSCGATFAATTAACIVLTKDGTTNIGSTTLTVNGCGTSVISMTGGVFNAATVNNPPVGGHIDIPSAVTCSNGLINATGPAKLLNFSSSTFTGAGRGTSVGVKAILTGPVWLDTGGAGCSSVFPSGMSACQLLQGAQDDIIDPTAFGAISINGGTLLNGQQAFSVMATQPAIPVASQNAVLWSVTGAGNASQVNNAFQFNYAAGYTGSSRNAAAIITNFNAGTGTTLIPAAGSNGVVGNVGQTSASAGSTNGYNVGTQGGAQQGAVNTGILGLSQVAKNSATNIGVAGSAINTGTTPVFVGGWFSLNQTSVPVVSAAMIADNAAQSVPVALFQCAGVTCASVNATGGITATLTHVSEANILCYNTGTGLVTYSTIAEQCTVSSARYKQDIKPLDDARSLQIASLLMPVSYKYKPDADLGDDMHLGLIAEQVATVAPELVVYDKDGKPNAIKQTDLPAIMFGAIKELKADNDNLRACQNSWKCRLFGMTP